MNDIWNTRPHRIANSHVAGVCEGIGVRYQIDPTLVRIAFAVITLCGGAGVQAYLIAWGLMAKEGEEASPFEAAFLNKKGDDTLGWTLGIIAFFMIFSGAFVHGAAAVSLILGIGALALAIYLLHQRQPNPEPELRMTPPAWDPLGAAPGAWHLPDPSPRPEPKPKKNLGLTLFVIGCAVVGFGYVANIVFIDDVGPQEVAITDASQLDTKIDGSVGPLIVDMSDLPPLTDDSYLDIDGGIGPVEVILPASQPVNLTCDTGLGPTNCVDSDRDAKLSITIDHGIGPVDVVTPTR